jgi:hypothetical protein
MGNTSAKVEIRFMCGDSPYDMISKDECDHANFRTCHFTQAVYCEHCNTFRECTNKEAQDAALMKCSDLRTHIAQLEAENDKLKGEG